ncbi:SPOC like C-terminal domain-containing protein [Scheffersomyces xylosifermentans]|uniref:SPOC like C-terminal domain-containing protein n=1 Tax=Scheffersomyces xylosifermentans TaxID=1304137 RepID=UPI00315D0891
MSTSKELTFFVVDLSGPMVSRHSGEETDLDIGLKYYYDHVANVLLKNRKIDRMGVILVHGTGNGSEDELEVLFDDEQFTYETFKRYSEKMRAANNNYESKQNEEGNSNIIDATLHGLDQFKVKIHLKYLRNLVVITNGEDPLYLEGEESLAEKISDYTDFINTYDIKVTVVGVGFDKKIKITEQKQENVKFWNQLMTKWNGRVLDAEALNRNVQYSSALKKVAPRALYTGSMTFGLGSEALSGEKNSNINEVGGLTLDVQMFPATRPEKLASGHTYDLSEKSSSSVKRITKHYYKKYKEQDDQTEIKDEESGDDADYEKVEVSVGDYVPGFKYSKHDIIAVNQDLAEIAQLYSLAGISIIGFIKQVDFPYAYFTDESSYVIPSKSASPSKMILFNSVVKSLLDLKSIALARVVTGDGKEVQLCSLTPQLVQIEGKYSYSFVAIRIALKEDQKIGRFPYLTEKTNSNTQIEDNDLDDLDEGKSANQDDSRKREYPSEDVIELMDSFVKSKDLDKNDKGTSHKHILANQKVALRETEFVNFGTTIKEMNTDAKLLPSNPANQKYNTNLKKIVIKSLEKESLWDFLNEDKFVEKYLVTSNKNKASMEEKSTNLFNLNNIVSGNTVNTKDWLSEINKDSLLTSENLKDSLKIKYLLKKDTSKRRQQAGTAFERFFRADGESAEEKKPSGGFGTFFDINDLLGD